MIRKIFLLISSETARFMKQFPFSLSYCGHRNQFYFTIMVNLFKFLCETKNIKSEIDLLWHISWRDEMTISIETFQRFDGIKKIFKIPLNPQSVVENIRQDFSFELTNDDLCRHSLMVRIPITEKKTSIAIHTHISP